ncbi:MAG: acyl-protein synthetase [Myxococcota bacterium]
MTGGRDGARGAARPAERDAWRADLDARVRAWMREAARAPAFARDDARFEALALELFAFQLAHCAPYARYCGALGRTRENVRGWRDVPAVPTGAFKELRIASFEPARTVKVFRTSGTTTQQRGELALDTLALYEASLLPTLSHLLFPDVAGRMRMRVLAPSPAEAPDSSLSHMFGCLLAARGTDASGFDVRDGALDAASLERALDDARRAREPVALLGTAFAFVHWLDARAGTAATPLPPGSRAMETGGFKGRAREVPRDELHAAIAAALGLPRSHVVNQYGMTELGSQFYDASLADPGGPLRKLGPPWARVRAIDPATGADVAPGEVGVLVVHDLANTGSVAAIETADLGRIVAAGSDAASARHGEGFVVLGRSPGAEERGCSIAADAMLGGEGAGAGPKPGGEGAGESGS